MDKISKILELILLDQVLMKKTLSKSVSRNQKTVVTKNQVLNTEIGTYDNKEWSVEELTTHFTHLIPSNLSFLIGGINSNLEAPCNTVWDPINSAFLKSHIINAYPPYSL